MDTSNDVTDVNSRRPELYAIKQVQLLKSLGGRSKNLIFRLFLISWLAGVPEPNGEPVSCLLPETARSSA